MLAHSGNAKSQPLDTSSTSEKPTFLHIHGINDCVRSDAESADKLHKELITLIKKTPSGLIELELVGFFLGKESIRILQVCLPLLEISKIHISGCMVEDSALLNSLIAEHPSLKIISVMENGIAGGQPIINRLMPGITARVKDNTLISLSLSGEMLSVEALKNLTDSLINNTSLKKLEASVIIRHNENGLCPLIKVLPITQIEELQFCWHRRTKSEIKALADFLATNPPLKILMIIGSDLDDEDVVKLAKALEKNTHLEVFALCDNAQNNVLDKALKAFAECLKINTGLKELNFYLTPLTKSGLQELLLSLVVNKDLRKLNLRGHGHLFDEQLKLVVDRVLKSNPMVETEIDLILTPPKQVTTIPEKGTTVFFSPEKTNRLKGQDCSGVTKKFGK